MKKQHADSQVDRTEALRLKMLALGSPEHRGSRRLVAAVAVSTQEMLGRWVLETPEGPLHTVAIVGLLDGQVREFSHDYREESDAVAVYDHVVATGRETGTIR